MKNTLLAAVLAAIVLVSVPGVASANNLWYSDEEKARINQELSGLQSQVDELKRLNAQLSAKVNDVPQAVAAPVTQVIETKETIVRDPDNTRVEALEKRVTVVEGTMEGLKKSVMDALATTISLLKRLLKI